LGIISIALLLETSITLITEITPVIITLVILELLRILEVILVYSLKRLILEPILKILILRILL
jgi:hypothetical protein